MSIPVWAQEYHKLEFVTSSQALDIFGVKIEEDGAQVKIGKIEGYDIFLVLIESSDHCGLSNCILRIFKKQGETYIYDQSARVSRRDIYQVNCGGDLYLVHQGAVSYGVWKYNPNSIKFFSHIVNMKDFTDTVSCRYEND